MLYTEYIISPLMMFCVYVCMYIHMDSFKTMHLVFCFKTLFVLRPVFVLKDSKSS